MVDKVLATGLRLFTGAAGSRESLVIHCVLEEICDCCAYRLHPCPVRPLSLYEGNFFRAKFIMVKALLFGIRRSDHLQ